MLFSSLLSKSLAVKVGLVVAGMSTAGVGAAAETGSLPAPIQQVAYHVAGGLGVPAATSGPTGTVRTTGEATATPDPSETPDPQSSAGPTPSAPEASHGPDATGPATKGLCQAYDSGRKAGKSPDSPAFQALLTAAGGADQVGAYCAQVLGSPTPAASSDGGVDSGHSAPTSGHADVKPPARPTTGDAGAPGKGSGSGIPTKGPGTGHGSGH